MSARCRLPVDGRTLLVVVGLMLVSALPAAGADDLAEVRATTARFHRVTAAQQAGWDLVPGLDHCFENPGVGAMGYHYINVGLLDAVTDPLTPESLVYAPGPQGQMRLAAVEWIVPDAAWQGENPPTVLGSEMHLNATLGVWVKHAWIFEHNPDGMFEDWNPRVSCP